MKRFLLFLFSILFLISVYKDLSTGIEINKEENFEVPSINEENPSFSVVKIKIMPGDTFISIMDNINEQNIQNFDQMIADFKSLNPNSDPYQLQVETFYYFPLYK
ncbi:hypothetical protein [Ornithinibacillus halophilus]|uniref:LysM domain-containing protein n=1 Tax=Ornithinibacillus halophilus TaxID=930117 RepID=A0A1M5D3H8_9BACI|nr:hypothetical protein [Ornithinibacillus halophilus]SHF61430.1 hypothetical protein SAMN05216225_1001507 [Ornithinibacillus halophilus]